MLSWFLIKRRTKNAIYAKIIFSFFRMTDYVWTGTAFKIRIFIMLHIIIFQVNTFFQIDFYYVDERKTDFPQKKSLFFHFSRRTDFFRNENGF